MSVTFTMVPAGKLEKEHEADMALNTWRTLYTFQGPPAVVGSLVIQQQPTNEVVPVEEQEEDEWVERDPPVTPVPAPYVDEHKSPDRMLTLPVMEAIDFHPSVNTDVPTMATFAAGGAMDLITAPTPEKPKPRVVDDAELDSPVF